MSNPTDYSQILYQAYDRFILNLGGKKVPTPYRINLPYQKDRRKYGKFNPSKLTHDTKEVAKEQNVNLEELSVEEIRQFMIKNQLGIDCSGFVYWIADYLLNQLGKGSMEQIGFPRASSTNVELLTTDQFTIPVYKIEDIKPGDFIKFNKGGGGVPHILIILEKNPQQIIYAHSSGVSEIPGVHQGTIKITNDQTTLDQQEWPEKLNDGRLLKDSFNPTADGVRRLKALV
jgi:hypothetical protein